MSKITEQARVIVIENHEIRRGTVGTLFEGLGLAIVNFDDGNVEKVRLSELGIEPVAEPTEKDQEPTEPVEKSEITITPKEFRITSVDLIVEMTKDIPLVGLALTAFASELHKKLFRNVVDND